jgi:hypothetical protein
VLFHSNYGGPLGLRSAETSCFLQFLPVFSLLPPLPLPLTQIPPGHASWTISERVAIFSSDSRFFGFKVVGELHRYLDSQLPSSSSLGLFSFHLPRAPQSMYENLGVQAALETTPVPNEARRSRGPAASLLSTLDLLRPFGLIVKSVQVRLPPCPVLFDFAVRRASLPNQ